MTHVQTSDSMPMREVLNLAIGSPDDGCINLRMLYAFLRQLMISGQMENVIVNLKAEGASGPGAAGIVKTGLAAGGSPEEAIQDLWQYIQLKKQVEANKKGIDNLYSMAGKLIDNVGDQRVVTWEALGGALAGFEHEKASGLVRQTAEGLERAKQYVKDPEKQAELDERKASILDKFDRISAGVSRRSSKRESGVKEDEVDDASDESEDENDDDDDEDGSPKHKERKSEKKQNNEDPTIATLDYSTLEGSFTEKTVNTLGKVAMLYGTNEARLNAVDEQLENLKKFKKTVSYMLQDLDVKGINDKIGLLNGSDVKSLNDLLKQLTETGGMEQLQKLIKSINLEGMDERQRLLEMQEKVKGLEGDAMMGAFGIGGRGADGLGAFGADGRGADGFGADGRGADGFGADGMGAMSAAEAQARMKGGLAAQARKMGMAERKVDRVSEELKSAKQELKNLMELVADLMKDMNAGKEMEGKMNDLKEMANKLQEELGKQNDLIVSMTEAISEYGAAIEMLKRQVRHLQDYKADKAWVLKELALKADLALLDNYVTKDDFGSCLEDFAKNLENLQSAQTSLNRFFDKEMKKLLEELSKKTTLDDFEGLRKRVNDGLDNLKRRLDWIAGVAGGEEEAAGMRIAKFHCVSCDRPVHTLKGQQPTTTVPALPGINVNQSANPFRVLERAKTGKTVNANNHNRGPLPDAKTSKYGTIVHQNEAQWRKKRDFCLNRKYGGQDPVLANRRDIFDIDTPGYYRVTDADKPVDIWRQNRGCGGAGTLIKPWQKIVGESKDGNGGGGSDSGGADGGDQKRTTKDQRIYKVAPVSSRSRKLLRFQNTNKNNDGEEGEEPECSDSKTDQATGVVAVPVDVIDQNIDIRGMTMTHYYGDPREVSLHPPTPMLPSPPNAPENEPENDATSRKSSQLPPSPTFSSAVDVLELSNRENDAYGEDAAAKPRRSTLIPPSQTFSSPLDAPEIPGRENDAASHGEDAAAAKPRRSTLIPPSPQFSFPMNAAELQAELQTSGGASGRENDAASGGEENPANPANPAMTAS